MLKKMRELGALINNEYRTQMAVGGIRTSYLAFPFLDLIDKCSVELEKVNDECKGLILVDTLRDTLMHLQRYEERCDDGKMSGLRILRCYVAEFYSLNQKEINKIQ